MTIQVGPGAARIDQPVAIATIERSFQPVSIAADRCKGCSLCVPACPKHVLALDEVVVNPLGYHPVRLTDATACTSCALCARICPDSVFTVYARPKAATR
jgi:2-oxoglutarate ferredoxin oxidoreductase subunit delta